MIAADLRVFADAAALDHRDDTPWDRVHVYWGDERDVPHNDDRSNYRMARESLLALIRTAGARLVWWADAEAAAHVAPRSLS